MAEKNGFIMVWTVRTSTIMVSALISSLIFAASALAQNTAGILFPNPKGGMFYAVRLAATPTPAEIEAALPPKAKSAGRTEWACSVLSDGHLDRCKLEAEWPAGSGFGPAAQSLIPKFRLDKQSTSDARAANAHYDFEISLFGRGLQVDEIPGDCPPPFCTAVIPPSSPHG